MASDQLAEAPLQDYPDRSVWTIWAISYQAIQEKHEATANLLLLWSFLDNKDLWYGLFAAGCAASPVAARMLSRWIGEIASSEIRFSKAMQLLRSYSLVEEVVETQSYVTHPVVHQWAYHSQGRCFATQLSRLSVIAIGWALPQRSTHDYTSLQRRLLAHAQACSRRIAREELVWSCGGYESNNEAADDKDEQGTVLAAVHLLGMLYYDQGKLGEAEQMYERALRGYEEALGLTHTSTLDTVNNLGALYRNQGKLGEAEQMYERALRGYEEALGHHRVQQYMPALNTLENLGDLYATRAESTKARALYAQALTGLSNILGQSSDRYIELAAKIDALPVREMGKEEQLRLSAVKKGSKTQRDGSKKSLRLSIRSLVRKVF
jgi:tetratricopeptide (TPR) repeat protein